MKNTTQHTPGPWELDGAEIYDSIDKDSAQMLVARIDYGAQGKTVMGDDDRANAALIAAAPELLAACNQVRGDLGSGLQASFGGDVTIDERTARTLVRVLDEAINKAKGQE